MTAVYRVGGLLSVYRWATAWMHLAMSDRIGRWGMWHAEMAKQIVEDETERTGGI